MWKVLLSCAGLSISMSILIPAIAQPDSIRYVSGLKNRYEVQYFKSSMTIKNVANKLKKPNYRPDTLSLRGLQLKSCQDTLTRAIQNLFPIQKWAKLLKGHKIAVELGVLKSGEIAELLSLIIPPDVDFSPTDVEQLESIVKSRSITVTDSSHYTKVNFISLFFPINPVR